MRQSGFSLMELIMVLIFTSILAGGMAHLFGETIDQIAVSEERVVATQLAQERMEQVLAERRADGYGTFSTASDSVLLAGKSYDRTVTVTPLTGGVCPTGMSCKEVLVEVVLSGAVRADITQLLVDY